MKSILQSLHRHRFFTLSSGVLAANVVSFVSMPLLTRMYPTESFGYFAIYFAVTTVVGTFSTLRLEAALPLAESDEDAAQLVWLGLGFSLVISLLTFLFLKFTPLLSYLTSIPTDDDFAGITALSVFFLGAIQMLAHLKVRTSDFKALAYRQVAERLSIALLSVLFARLLWQTYGLIVAQALGFLLSVVLLTIRNGSLFRPSGSRIWIHGTKTMLLKYREFPSKNVASTGFQTFAGQAAPLILSYFFSDSQIGQLNLVQRLVDAPVPLIGSSLGLVYYRRLLNVGAEHRRRLFSMVLNFSLAGFIAPGIIVMIFAKPIIVILLGERWAEASALLVALIPAGVARLIYTLQQPLFLASRRLDLDLYMSASLCFGIAISLATSAYMTGDIFYSVLGSSITVTLIYLVGLVLLWKLSREPVEGLA